jgi:hypothetical protein
MIWKGVLELSAINLKPVKINSRKLLRGSWNPSSLRFSMKKRMTFRKLMERG